MPTFGKMHNWSIRWGRHQSMIEITQIKSPVLENQRIISKYYQKHNIKNMNKIAHRKVNKAAKMGGKWDK